MNDEAERMIRRLEREAKARQDAEKIAQLRARELYDANAQLKETLDNLNHIVEQRTAEMAKALELAEEANRAKAEFLSAMGHELRTPMNAILGFAQFLKLAPDDPLTPKQLDSVDMIMRGGYHLLGLIDDLLDLSKLDAGHLSLDQEMTNLSTIISDSVALVRVEAERKNINLDLPTAAVIDRKIFCDPMRLRQCLINLLSNAVKYNHTGGDVCLSVSFEAADNVCLAVRDSGFGMNETQIAHLFEPFTRLHKTRTDIQGTGIGLSITKSLTEMMGGTLDCQSQEGIGSQFIITLPMKAPNKPQT